MKTTSTPRIVAFLLVLTLCLPNSAFALRGQQQEDPSQLTGLEEAFKDPAKAIHRLAQLVAPSPSQEINPNLLPAVTSGSLEGTERTGLEEVVVDLNDSQARDPNRVGSKMASLAELRSIENIKVPPGFTVSTEAYRHFLKYNELEPLIQALEGVSDRTQLLQQGKNIREVIVAGEFPPEVEKAILDRYDQFSKSLGVTEVRVAVRSSATAEDLPGASFAGRYDTFLNQMGGPEVMGAVKRVWASTFNDRAIIYRSQNEISHSKTQMAVGILKMVDAEVAGTGFSVDLETGNPMITLHTLYGLGEAEVSGIATPDTWIVDPQVEKLLKRRLGSKTHKIIFDAASRQNVIRETDKHERSNYAILPGLALGLGLAVHKIAQHYRAQGKADQIDTEFAIEGRSIIFTQARPETVWSQDKSGLLSVDLHHGQVKGLPRLLEGGTGLPGVVSGTLRVVSSEDPDKALALAETVVQPGDILVGLNTSNVWEDVLGRAGGAIMNVGGGGSHTAVVMRESKKPAIIGVPDATEVLKPFDGKTITLDGTQKIVFLGKVPLDALAQRPSQLLPPRYGTLDQVSEGEAWAEAKQSTTTREDSDGRRWIAKPPYKVGPFMQAVYRAVYEWMGHRLQSPVSVEVRDGVVWVDFHDVFQWRVKLRAFSLEDLEALHAERLKTAESYLVASEQLQLTPEGFLEWLDLYIQMNAWMSVAYDIYRVTEGMLEAELAQRQTPEPYYSQVRPAMGALLGETEAATSKLKEYRALLEQVRESGTLHNLLNNIGQTSDLPTLQNHDSGFYQKLEGYALSFKVTRGTDPTLPASEPILQVIRNLQIDLGSSRQITITSPQPEEFYPGDEQFGRVARLALGSEKARQDTHHQKIRGQWRVRQQLSPLIGFLLEQSELSAAEELFNQPPDYLLRQIIRYQMTNRLGLFLGHSVGVPPLSEWVTVEHYRQLRQFGFDLFYLPAPDVASIHDTERYPGWKHPLAKRYWETAIVERQPWNGRWVAVEFLEVPSQGVPLVSDSLMDRMGVRTRLVSWKKIHADILPQLARILKVPSSAVQLPHALEWNFIGNLLRYLNRVGGSYPDWGASAAWEWTEGRYGREHRLLVGKNGTEGMDGLSAVAWIFEGDVWFNIASFRILVDLSFNPDVSDQEAGLEEGGTAASVVLRDRINLLPGIRTEQASVGVIAGPADPRGWAYGLALLKRSRTATDRVIPVIFLVEDEDQMEILWSLGVTPEMVFRIGSAEYPTQEVALGEVTDYLHRGLEIPLSNIIQLGVSEKISPVVEQVLINLFGIRLDASAAVEWKDVIDAVVYAFQQT